MAAAGMITCKDNTTLHELLNKLTGMGLEFHATDAFSLIDSPLATVLFTAEKDVLEKICAIANFKNDYQI